MEAARAELERAMLELDGEAERLRKAEADVAAFASQLAAADPDGPAFGKLVGQREVARARVSALEVRIEERQTTVSRAQAAVEEIERSVRTERVAQLEAQIAEADAAITLECIRFREHLVERIAALRALTDQAGTLSPEPWSARPRNSYWAGVKPSEVMLAALGAVGAIR